MNETPARKGKVTRKPLGPSYWETFLADLGQREGNGAATKRIVETVRQHADVLRRLLGIFAARGDLKNLAGRHDLDVGFLYAIADLLDEEVETLGRLEYVLPYMHHSKASRTAQLTSSMRERVIQDPIKRGALKRAAIAELVNNSNVKIKVETAIRYYHRDYPAKDSALATQATEEQQRSLTGPEWRGFDEQRRDERERAARSAARRRQRQPGKS